MSIIKLGGRVTDAEAPRGGVHPADPIVLASQARVSPDAYAMGRVLASEGSTGSAAERAAIAWVLRNDARAAGRSILDHVVASSNPKARGRFGSQNVGGRRFSSRFDPRKGDIALALQVLGGQVQDPTGGATKFLHPDEQDKLARSGEKGYGRTAATVIAEWSGDGYQLRQVPGVSRGRFVVFVKPRGILVA